MRKLILAAIAVISMSLAAPLAVYQPSALAVDIAPACTSGSASDTVACDAINQGESSSKNPVIHVIKVAIGILSYIIGAIAVIMIIVGGFRMITSQGDAQAVAQARSGIIYAAVALVVAASAQLIVVFVLNKLG